MFLIQGDFVMGKRHGQGVYNYSDGGRYEGTWVDDRIEGTGTSYYANKNVYEGQVNVRNFKQIYCFNGVNLLLQFGISLSTSSCSGKTVASLGKAH